MKNSNQFTAAEANKALRGIITALCNAISEFSDSEDGELVQDGHGFRALCASMDLAQICANRIPNPEAHSHQALVDALRSFVDSHNRNSLCQCGLCDKATKALALATK